MIQKILLSITTFFATFLCSWAAPPNPNRIECDLLIVGGTESGCAAALQAARMGVKHIVLVNDTRWLGGQFSSEALGAIDENRGRTGTNDTPFPRSGLFLEVIQRIEKKNFEKYGVARPGNTVVKNTVLPHDAAEIFNEMLQPYSESGQIRILSAFQPVKCFVDQDQLLGVHFQELGDSSTPSTVSVHATITIDASDWGDVIRLSKAGHRCGPELKSEFQEPTAPTDRETYPLTDMNPINWGLVIEETDQEAVIPKPDRYDERRYLMATALTYDDWTKVGWKHPRLFGKGFPMPDRIYTGRRLLDAKKYDLKTKHDMILINIPPINYPLDHLPLHVVDELEKLSKGSSKKNIAEMTRAERDVIYRDCQLHTLGYLYHLQTTVYERSTPQQRAQVNFRKFRLPDYFGTANKLPPKPYLRESLHLKAQYIMKEQDTLKTDRAKDQYATVMYEDGIACWQFEYDFHPTGRAFHPTLGTAGPWECYGKPGRGWGPYSDRALLPIRSMIPEKLDRLIAAQKNLGYTSIVSSAVRLHDQSMMIGQSAGATSATGIEQQLPLQKIYQSPKALNRIRSSLCSPTGGQPLVIWPFADLQPDDVGFAAANMLAMNRLIPLNRTEVNIQPKLSADLQWMRKLLEHAQGKLPKNAKVLTMPATTPQTTRGEYLKAWYDLLRQNFDLPVLK
ncbi:MAG: FAD-dependent oxidoreductase [Zavarzinella sp.]